MARILEGAIAAGVGAAEAAVGARRGPGNVSAAVYLEGAGLLLGLFGGVIGVPGEIRDSVLLGSLALAGKRATQAAMTGALLKGPAAWGGDGDGSASSGAPFYAAGGNEGGGARYVSANRPYALLGRGGGFSISPLSKEAAGTAG